MQLSQNLFGEITGIKAGVAGNGDSDRRSHRRILFDHRARIFPLMEGIGEEGAAVLVRDISVGGIGFLCSDPIGVGDEFVIRVPTTTEQPIDMQCAARRCELSGTCGSQFAVGATFELVLNRPLSTSVAPESEMLPDADPIVDQPAPPTIEQRYDRQCITSRLIRPIIRQTRWDRWMAKPLVQKINRVLARILWPAMVVWKAIHSVLRAGEESRIRHRLNPGRAAKKARRKKEPARVLAPAPMEPVAALQADALTAAANAVAILHPQLFEAAPIQSAWAASSVDTATPDLSRRSIFAPETVSTGPAAPKGASKSVLVESVPPRTEFAAAVPPAPASPTPSPTASAALTPAALPFAPTPSEPPQAVPIVMAPQPIIEPVAVSEPIAIPAVAPSVTDGQSTDAPVQQKLPSQSTASKFEVEPERSADSAMHSAEAPTGTSDSAMPFNDGTRAETSPRQARPPVAHSRQSRRRPRSAFHR